MLYSTELPEGELPNEDKLPKREEMLGAEISTDPDGTEVTQTVPR